MFDLKHYNKIKNIIKKKKRKKKRRLNKVDGQYFQLW